MFQLEPTQKLRQDHKLKKPKFRMYFTSLPWKEVIILTNVYAVSHKKPWKQKNGAPIIVKKMPIKSYHFNVPTKNMVYI